jgi:hypothetical protein
MSVAAKATLTVTGGSAVVRFGGYILLTCPSARFPLTYDPVNWVLSRMGTHISMGAFGYGHSWLVYEEELTRWAGDAGLEILDSAHISKALAAIVEAYWPSLIQSIAKANAENRGGEMGRCGEKPGSRARLRPTIRPTREPPRLCALTDALITADDHLFLSSQPWFFVPKSALRLGRAVLRNRPRPLSGFAVTYDSSLGYPPDFIFRPEGARSYRTGCIISTTVGAIAEFW